MLLIIVALVVLASLVVVPAVSASALPGNEKHNDGGTCTYRVVWGDTLSKIAVRHHTSIWELKELNKRLKNPNCIYAGEWLVVPCGHESHTGCNQCGKEYKQPVKYGCDNWGCYAPKPKPTHY